MSGEGLGSGLGRVSAGLAGLGVVGGRSSFSLIG